MFLDSKLEPLSLMRHGETKDSVPWWACLRVTRFVRLNSLTRCAAERFHDLLLRMIPYSHRPAFPPLITIALSPVWKDTASVVETPGIAELPSAF